MKKPKRNSVIHGSLIELDLSSSTLATVQPIQRKRKWNIFASRFTNTTGEHHVESFLSGRGLMNVKASKLVSKIQNPRHSSFHVSFDAPDPGIEIYQPEFWPAGAIVRRWFNRQPKEVENESKSPLLVNSEMIKDVPLIVFSQNSQTDCENSNLNTETP